MPRTGKTKDDRVFQLKITLKGSKPPIRRRVQVRGDTPLDTLHHIFQIAMGWTDSHLHQFKIGGELYGMLFDDGLEDTCDENEFTLAQVAGREKSKFKYEYDFGDGWIHDVVVEAILPAEEGVALPRCLDGKQACPPEDCGGLWGFYNLLDAIRDPQHPEHKDLSEWLGGDFDPDAFEVDRVNRNLSWLRAPSRAVRSR